MRRARIKQLLIVSAACLVVLASIMAWRGGAAIDNVAPSEKSTAVNAARFLLIPGARTDEHLASQLVAAPAPQGGVAHPLHKVLLSSRDVRVFYEKMRVHPELGGVYYASLANERCWRARLTIDAATMPDPRAANVPHEIAYRKDEAIGKLKTLCAGFLDAEESAQALQTLLRSDVAKDDILFGVQRELVSLTSQRSPDKYRDALIRLFDQASPEAIMNSSIGLTSGGYYFNGKTFMFGSDDTVLFEAAKTLALCELGDSCGPDDFLLVSACASNGVCVNSRSDLVRQNLANRKDPTADLAYVSELSKKMADAIRTRKVDLFIPQK